MSAGKCTQIDGSHKLKNFDDDIPEIQRNLKERENTGKKSHIAETHGDYIKSCVMNGKVNINWIATKENEADIMTKPLEIQSFTYLRDKIL